MSWFFSNLIATFLQPPLSLLLLLALGVILIYRRHKFANKLILVAFIMLWIASTPFIAEGSLHLLEAQTAPVDITRQQADAIVILGGGTYFHAPEYAAHRAGTGFSCSGTLDGRRIG
jgi:uncharacterized SAM-binding protein YcdF (DUF218 family)